MDNRYSNIHYFVFKPEHELHGYYIKMIGGTETQSKKAFKFLFGYDSKPQKEKVIQNCPMGCYREFYPPLPEMLSISGDGTELLNEYNDGMLRGVYNYDFCWINSGDIVDKKTDIQHKKNLSKIENRKDFAKMKNYKKK